MPERPDWEVILCSPSACSSGPEEDTGFVHRKPQGNAGWRRVLQVATFTVALGARGQRGATLGIQVGQLLVLGCVYGCRVCMLFWICFFGRWRAVGDFTPCSSPVAGDKAPWARSPRASWSALTRACLPGGHLQRRPGRAVVPAALGQGFGRLSWGGCVQCLRMWLLGLLAARFSSCRWASFEMRSLEVVYDRLTRRMLFGYWVDGVSGSDHKGAEARRCIVGNIFIYRSILARERPTASSPTCNLAPSAVSKSSPGRAPMRDTKGSVKLTNTNRQQQKPAQSTKR